jgi:hypothetical protein
MLYYKAYRSRVKNLKVWKTVENEASASEDENEVTFEEVISLFNTETFYWRSIGDDTGDSIADRILQTTISTMKIDCNLQFVGTFIIKIGQSISKVYETFHEALGYNADSKYHIADFTADHSEFILHFCPSHRHCKQLNSIHS